MQGTAACTTTCASHGLAALAGHDMECARASHAALVCEHTPPRQHLWRSVPSLHWGHEDCDGCYGPHGSSRLAGQWKVHAFSSNSRHFTSLPFSSSASQLHELSRAEVSFESEGFHSCGGRSVSPTRPVVAQQRSSQVFYCHTNRVKVCSAAAGLREHERGCPACPASVTNMLATVKHASAGCEGGAHEPSQLLVGRRGRHGAAV